MTEVDASADNPGIVLGSNLANFSPKRDAFVTLVHKGNLATNTNDWSLLLFHIADIFRSPRPRVLLTLSSSSNAAGISEIRWLSDNVTLLFIGASPQRVRQLYSFNTRTDKLTRLTDSKTNVLTYGFTPSGDRIAYTTREPIADVWDEKAQRNGLPLTPTESVYQLILGKRQPELVENQYIRLSIISRGHPRANLLTKRIRALYSLPVFSPDGKYIVMKTQVTSVPKSWYRYSNLAFVQQLSTNHNNGLGINVEQPTYLYQYQVIDAASGNIHPLINAPTLTDSDLDVNLTGGSWPIAWSPDSRSVVVVSTFLPFNVADSQEQETRAATPFTVEINLHSNTITKITKETVRSPRWDAVGSELVFEQGTAGFQSPGSRWVLFRKYGNLWRKIGSNITKDPFLTNVVPEIQLEQGMNLPPRIVAIDPETRRKAVVLDLNPQFKYLRLAREEEIHWWSSDRHEWKGGLYYPIGYVAGKRYPLVIQTHGFVPDQFWIDGPSASGFAAQALAGRGIMVLQTDPDMRADGTMTELQDNTAMFDAAIAYLDGKQLIDPYRVGIVGWSLTTDHVAYALIHSHYRFAAAAFPDAVGGNYLLYLFDSIDFRSHLEGLFGGSPFARLQSWVRFSTSFNLDKVKTPIRIVADAPYDLLWEWDWFVGLNRLKKPVDMVLLQDGNHVLQRPWERMVMQGGNVDWFDFWLKGHEDHDPAKRAQYKRWAGLRKLQEQNQFSKKFVNSNNSL